MSNGEYGNDVAELESRKMEIQNGIGAGIEQLRTQDFTAEQFDSIKKNLAELNETL